MTYMTYNDYSLSLKISDYDKTSISEKRKICIDEMLDANISFDDIVKAVGITERELNEYYHNEWCYKNPERYFYVTWVNWVNIYVKKGKSKTK